jgi:electron transport complex protein RnfG
MKDLPTVQNGSPPPDVEGGAAEHEGPEISSFRLMTTLAVAGALAGLVIVLVFGWAEPRIQAHRAAALRAAVNEVLSSPATYQALYVTPDGLSAAPPAGADTATAEKVFLGFDAAGDPVGYAVTGAEPGYQDLIHLIFGYDPSEELLLGMKVLESKETPGLGDKIFKDADFVDGFNGTATPLIGVKPGEGTGDPREVDMITGATISSRTVIGTINHRLEALAGAIAAHAATAPTAPPAPADTTAPGEALAEGGDGGS